MKRNNLLFCSLVTLFAACNTEKKEEVGQRLTTHADLVELSQKYGVKLKEAPAGARIDFSKEYPISRDSAEMLLKEAGRLDAIYRPIHDETQAFIQATKGKSVREYYQLLPKYTLRP
jgi:hypothetical protein